MSDLHGGYIKPLTNMIDDAAMQEVAKLQHGVAAG
jgi:hypothetical protein